MCTTVQYYFVKPVESCHKGRRTWRRWGQIGEKRGKGGNGRILPQWIPTKSAVSGLDGIFERRHRPSIVLCVTCSGRVSSGWLPPGRMVACAVLLAAFLASVNYIYVQTSSLLRRSPRKAWLMNRSQRLQLRAPTTGATQLTAFSCLGEVPSDRQKLRPFAQLDEWCWSGVFRVWIVMGRMNRIIASA